jgi:hypothetical protein
MSIFYNTRIIRSNLVYHTDPANKKSYPGTGTVLSDLTASAWPATLQNSPTYTTVNLGEFTYNGSTQYASVVGSITTNELTLSSFIYSTTSTQSAYAGIFFSRGANVTGLDFYSTSTFLGYHWNDQFTTYSFSSGLVIPTNQWCMVTLSANATTGTLYVNLTSATNTTSHPTTTINNLTYAQDTGGRNFAGKIGPCLVYNRALTLGEIQQNYNAYAKRYGLPTS